MAIIKLGQRESTAFRLQLDVLEKLRGVQSKTRTSLETLEDAVIPVVTGQVHGRFTGLLGSINSAQRFGRESVHCFPPPKVRIVPENDELSLPGLPSLDNAVTNGVGK